MEIGRMLNASNLVVSPGRLGGGVFFDSFEARRLTVLRLHSDFHRFAAAQKPCPSPAKIEF